MLLACTEHAKGALFSFSEGTRLTLAEVVIALGILSFLAILFSSGNRRVERGGYAALILVITLGGGVLLQGEMEPIGNWF